MKHSIENGPAFAWLRAQLDAGERIDAVAGALVTATPRIRPAAHTRGIGRPQSFLLTILLFFVGGIRRVLGHDSSEVETFEAPEGGEIVLAPELPGTVLCQEITPERSLMIMSGALLASAGVERRTRFSGLRGLLESEPLHFVHVKGQGMVFLGAYGGAHAVEVDGQLVVDTGHVLAFDPSLRFKVRPAARGLWASLFSAEGLVCRFEGKGKIWIQGRNADALAEFILPHVNAR